MRVGEKYKIYYNPNNPNNRRIHVVGIVDGNQIITKYYNRVRWVYTIERIEYYEMLINDGFMKKVSRGNK